MKAAPRLALLALALVVPGLGWADEILVLPTRNSSQKVLRLEAPGQTDKGIVLISGGNGVSSLERVMALPPGQGNQLIRTRAGYAAQGFVVLVPEIAADLKPDGLTNRDYRLTREHAEDIANVIAYLRQSVPKAYLVGTSMAALSIVNVLANIPVERGPDAAVITTGLLLHTDYRVPSAHSAIGRLERVKAPLLLVGHRNDRCRFSSPASMEPFARLLINSPRVDIKTLEGGWGEKGDPCEAEGAHGFGGMDDVVVETISSWLKASPN